jgi:hypothetical protein
MSPYEKSQFLFTKMEKRFQSYSDKFHHTEITHDPIVNLLNKTENKNADFKQENTSPNGITSEEKSLENVETILLEEEECEMFERISVNSGDQAMPPS